MPNTKVRWLNRTVLGVALASLFSDWSHEIATTVLPAFLASMGVAAAWLGLIEGVADGLSSFAKMGSGYFTDKLARRKPIAVAGYVVTALGTASFGFATAAWHVLVARSAAWLGRGVRTPVRKALLAGAVTRETYGRAFGFERMMDTIGAIVGPATAFALLPLLGHRYPRLFALTLIPGLTAAFLIAFLVKEKERLPVKHISFGQRLRLLPAAYRKFLAAAGLFGAGSFAHSMLILLAVQKLTPSLGAAHAATAAVGLYILHNIFYASMALAGGWLGDRLPKQRLLAAGYLMSAAMAVCVIVLPPSLPALALIFILGGTSVAFEETLEDSLCAELVTDEQHGMAFGSLAAVNGAGDFLSSVIVGALWTALGTGAAFGYSAALSVAGAILVLRLRPSTAGA
ncbi:MAG TPA: MFS transporter [Verrucomicrobiae bacterium]|jgi:MFS family permease|nr:MFS transporter [Verrucomicrobiae bacterium]